jgi:RpiR family transcriptional regulator, carbohydrate utilization regulator
MLTKLRNLRPGLSQSEQRVADLVLRQPQWIIDASIAMLAKKAAVSQPTVIRFCRSLGLNGYLDFRLKLAQTLAAESAPGVPYVHVDVKATDRCADIVSKVFDRAAGTLMRVGKALDIRAMDGAIKALTKANRVEFYGVGNSSVVAQDAQYKFFRLGMPAIHYADSHMNNLSAPLLNKSDVVVAISASGRTRELCRSAQLARNAGATVIAITIPRSPLSTIADITLNAEVEEDPDLYSPMTSRIVHLTIIDALAVGVALARGPKWVSKLEKSKDELRVSRLPR